MMFVVEMLLGLIVPLVMTLFSGIRNSPRWLGIASALVMLGVILNRTNVYLIGYQPTNVTKVYFPSLSEWGLTIGVIAALCVCWRAIVTYFPVISQPSRASVA